MYSFLCLKDSNPFNILADPMLLLRDFPLPKSNPNESMREQPFSEAGTSLSEESEKLTLSPVLALQKSHPIAEPWLSVSCRALTCAIPQFKARLLPFRKYLEFLLKVVFVFSLGKKPNQPAITAAASPQPCESKVEVLLCILDVVGGLISNQKAKAFQVQLL